MISDDLKQTVADMEYGVEIVVTIDLCDIEQIRGGFPNPQPLGEHLAELSCTLAGYTDEDLFIENELNRETIQACIPWTIIKDVEIYTESRRYQIHLESRFHT